MAPELSSSGRPAPQSKRAVFGSYLNSLSEIANLNNLRQVQATYDPRQSPHTLKLQLLIKSQKGVVSDAEALGREAHSASKQLYLWANEQTGEDLRDVGDRLAFLTYLTGDIELQYARSLEQARGELKELRNKENELAKLRDRCRSLESQTLRSRPDSRARPEIHERFSALKAESQVAFAELGKVETSVASDRRHYLRSSYHAQFEAMRELGEKLSIIGGYGNLLLNELSDQPPAIYDGKERTAWVKGATSLSLSGYQGPLIERPDLGRPPIGLNTSPKSPTHWSSLQNADTRSFAETHRHVLTDVTSSTIPWASSSHHSSMHSVPPEISGSGSLSSSQSLSHMPVAVAPTLRPRPSLAGKGSDFRLGPHVSTTSSDVLPSGPGPSAALSQGTFTVDPTVAENGASIPSSSHGPATGRVPSQHAQDQPPSDEQLPAYTPVSRLG